METLARRVGVYDLGQATVTATWAEALRSETTESPLLRWSD